MPEQDEPRIRKFWYRYYPELRFFKSRQELREAKDIFRKQGSLKRRGWGVVLVLAVAAAVLSAVAFRWLVSLGLSTWLALVINMAAFALFGAFVSLFLWHRPYIRFVRQYLQDVVAD